MKNLIFGLTLFLVAGLAQNSQAQQSSESKLLVVKFHADWCGACKAISPTFEALPGEFEGKAVSFYQFDLTNEETKQKSTELATQLGLSDLFDANQKTGFVLVLDAKTKEVKETLTQRDNLNKMSTKINALL